VRLLWAEAIGLAAWLLLWAGYGEAAWYRAGVRRRQVLATGLLVWGAGALIVRGVDIGLFLLATLAAARLWGRWHAVLRAAGWGLAAAAGRAYAPIDPYQATVLPAVGIEAVLLGLAATAGVAEAPTAGAVAVAAAVVADALRLSMGPRTAGWGPTAWLYALTAGIVAFSVAAGRTGVRLGRAAS
jgi:hypothetical protein